MPKYDDEDLLQLDDVYFQYTGSAIRVLRRTYPKHDHRTDTKSVWDPRFSDQTDLARLFLQQFIHFTVTCGIPPAKVQACFSRIDEFRELYSRSNSWEVEDQLDRVFESLLDGVRNHPENDEHEPIALEGKAA